MMTFTMQSFLLACPLVENVLEPQVSVLMIKQLKVFPVAYVCVARYPWLQVACSVIVESAIK